MTPGHLVRMLLSMASVLATFVAIPSFPQGANSRLHLLAATAAPAVPTAQPGTPPAAAPESSTCTGWTSQGGPQTDAQGWHNANFPEASTTTYWITPLQAALGSVVTIHGTFPHARFMALEIYTSDQLVSYLNDVNIVPDPGQNNPFISGTAYGAYSASLIFGQAPSNPPPNTFYTGTLTSTKLAYRIYHATDPNSPAGDTALPVLALNGQTLPSCPIQPFIAPNTTPWARMANADWSGTPPTATLQISVTNPPVWSIVSPFSAHFFPNGADYYMGAALSRQFLQPHTSNNIYVVRFKVPTFPNTRAGQPVSLARQVRFWSLCTDDPYTTNVNRCVPDDQTLLDAHGFATFVISDPGAEPSAATLAAYSATWLPWGALQLPTDVVYDRSLQPWGISSPVQYYNSLIYRQTLANSSFTQSFLAVFARPRREWQAAMGPYWPVGGYCSTATFTSVGPACLPSGTATQTPMPSATASPVATATATSG